MSRSKVFQKSLSQRCNKCDNMSEMLLGMSRPKVAQESLNQCSNKPENKTERLLGMSRCKMAQKAETHEATNPRTSQNCCWACPDPKWPRELKPVNKQTRQHIRNVAGHVYIQSVQTELKPALQQTRHHVRNVAGSVQVQRSPKSLQQCFNKRENMSEL